MAALPVCVRRGNALEVHLKVTPGGHRDAIGTVGDDGTGTLRLAVTVTAKAEGDAANRAVIRLLAKAWGIPPTSLTIASGHRSRLKRLRLDVPPEKAAAVVRALS